MSEAVAPEGAEDAAWAAVNTPLSVEELRSFCYEDVERLLRINPLYEFSQWQQQGDNRYRLHVKNISQETPFEVDTDIEVEEGADELRLKYSSGLKTSTTFKIEPAEQGSKLTITDRYEGLSEQERENRLGEVDKSIAVWAKYLQQYLLGWKRWSRFGLWRWYMRRVWQPMKPTARRITYIILWITVVEIALIILGAAIYFVEYA